MCNTADFLQPYGHPIVAEWVVASGGEMIGTRAEKIELFDTFVYLGLPILCKLAFILYTI